VPVASVTHDLGANYDDFTIRVPDGVLQTGENLLVALAVDRGGNTAFDVSLTTGVELPEFDDSAYAIGTASFSDGLGDATPADIYAGSTLWPPNTKLVARLRFNVADIVGGVTLRFGIDNDVTIFINGKQIATVTHEGPAHYDDYAIPVPDGVIQTGENLIVALAADRGGDTAFDMSLTADGATPAARVTFGALKARYRWIAQPEAQGR